MPRCYIKNNINHINMLLNYDIMLEFKLVSQMCCRILLSIHSYSKTLTALDKFFFGHRGGHLKIISKLSLSIRKPYIFVCSPFLVDDQQVNAIQYSTIHKIKVLILPLVS